MNAVAAPANKDTQAYRIASKLMMLLEEQVASDALWWLDEQTFAADPKHFQSKVLDPHFRGTKYASFLRTMHKMGFARISRRFDLPKGVVAYACDFFQRGKPELIHNIRMNNSGKQAHAFKMAMAAQAQASKETRTSPTTATKTVVAPPEAAPSTSPPLNTLKPPSLLPSKQLRTAAIFPEAAQFPELPRKTVATDALRETPLLGMHQRLAAAKEKLNQAERVRLIQQKAEVGLRVQQMVLQERTRQRAAVLLVEQQQQHRAATALAAAAAAASMPRTASLELALLREALSKRR